MTTTSIRRRIATSIFALAIAHLAHAELPERTALQFIEPESTDVADDPTSPPDSPVLGWGVAVVGNVALAGMPGAFQSRGRVAALVRNTAGKWIRRQTLTPSDPAVGDSFGSDVAIFNNRALITSRKAVYIFQLQSGTWRQTGKLSFGRSVLVDDLDWHWNTVVVGASDATGHAAFVFHMNADGTFTRIARLAPPDAEPGDHFGQRVAVYSSTVAVTAPGYNSEQGAAYVFGCSETRCVERQKLLVNDGERGDRFGVALDLANGILVIGAQNADWVPGDETQAPSEQNYHAGGSAYLFVRSGSTWTEQQKFRPSPAELNWYGLFGYEVAVSATHVVVSAPYGTYRYEPGYAIDYRWSGGVLVANKVMVNQGGLGQALALHNDTVFAGAPNYDLGFGGAVAVYDLAR